MMFMNPLHSLRLEWNYLGSRECLVPLLDSLSSNRSLLELDLRNNQIGPEGGELIAAMLRKNHTLEQLGTSVAPLELLMVLRSADTLVVQIYAGTTLGRAGPRPSPARSTPTRR